MTLRTSGRIFVLAVGLLAAGRTPVVDAQSNTVVSTENSDSGVRVAKPETTPDLPRWNPKKPILGARINPYSVLSAGVYAASWTDMLKTESSLPNFREDDPLARPFVALPRAPIFRVIEPDGDRSELGRLEDERIASLAQDLVASTGGIHCGKHERIRLYLLEHQRARGSQFCFQDETAIDIC